MAMEIVVGGCYLVSLLEPFKDINEVSPIKVPVALTEGWRMTTAATALKKVQNKRMHPSIVLRYNSATKNAVILVGSTRPQHAHRFVPCFGTRRLSFQTRETLRPNPLEAFSVRQGHFNFSRAIHVRVLQPHEYDVPAFFQDCRDEEGELEVTFDEVQRTLLKGLHTAYWNGQHYLEDGNLVVPSTFDSPSSPCAEHRGGRGGQRGRGGSSPTSQQRGPSTDPILGPSGLRFSTRMANLLEREDERGLQLQLLDDDEDISSISAPFVGLFQPFAHSFFHEVELEPDEVWHVRGEQGEEKIQLPVTE